MKRHLFFSAAAALAATVFIPLAPPPLVTAAALTQSADAGTTSPARSETATIRLTIDGYASRQGEVWIGVYASEADWNDGREIFAGTKALEGDPVVAEFDLAPGRYAIQIFHDENANNDFDTGLFGIPTERYGFSNGARPRLRTARWDEAAFTVSEGSIHEETITLGGIMN